MSKYALIVLFVITSIAAKSQSKDSIDYVIYRAIVKNTITGSKQAVAVMNMTSRDGYHNPWYGDTATRSDIVNGWMFNFQTHFDSSSYMLFREYDRKSMSPKELRDSFKVLSGFLFVEKAWFRELFNSSVQGGWKKFYEKYPELWGVFEFSDVHYSKDMSKAIVYYSYQRNGLNGGGRIVMLEETNGRWKVIQSAAIWIS